MPSKKVDLKTEETQTEAKAVVSRIGEFEENPTPQKKGDVVTAHGNTITYN